MCRRRVNTGSDSNNVKLTMLVVRVASRQAKTDMTERPDSGRRGMFRQFLLL